MAEDTIKSKRRRLRQAVTMRERAERTSTKESKPTRLRSASRVVGSPFRVLGRLIIRFSKIGFWKPIRKPLRFIGNVIFPKYFRNSIRELRMVTWPNGKQTRQLTRAVIAFSVIFGLFVAAFDYGLDKIFKQVIAK